MPLYEWSVEKNETEKKKQNTKKHKTMNKEPAKNIDFLS